MREVALSAKFAVILIGQSSNTPEQDIIRTTQTYWHIMNIFIVVFVVFMLFYFLIRLKSYRSVMKRRSDVSEMTPEELRAIYGGEDIPDIDRSLDRLSREELRIIAEKELEKRGIKPGEKDFFKGPLDWDDLDENFQPRPKIIRSDLCFPDSSKIAEKYKPKEKKENNSNNSNPD